MQKPQKQPCLKSLVLFLVFYGRVFFYTVKVTHCRKWHVAEDQSSCGSANWDCNSFKPTTQSTLTMKKREGTCCCIFTFIFSFVFYCRVNRFKKVVHGGNGADFYGWKWKCHTSFHPLSEFSVSVPVSLTPVCSDWSVFTGLSRHRPLEFLHQLCCRRCSGGVA